MNLRDLYMKRVTDRARPIARPRSNDPARSGKVELALARASERLMLQSKLIGQVCTHAPAA